MRLPAVIAAWAAFTASGAFAQSLRPITITDGIESTRIVSPSDQAGVLVSPDGRRYAVLLVRGDLDRNGVEAELVTGELASIESARPRTVARFFTTGLGGDGEGRRDFAWLLWPGANVPVWIDSRRVAFLWVDPGDVKQVVAIDTLHGKAEFLTQSDTDVLNFAVGPASTIVYRARMQIPLTRSHASMKSGFAVRSIHAIPLLAGYADGTNNYDLRWSNGIFLARPGHPDRQVQSQSDSADRYWYRQPAVFSPDGRSAIMSRSPEDWPAYWRNYESQTLKRVLDDRARDPDGYLARQLDQLYVIDLAAATTRPLWNSPIDAYGARPAAIAWSPDARHVLVAPTLLPLVAPAYADSEGVSAAVIDTGTGAYARLPISAEVAGSVSSARWISPQRIQLRLRAGECVGFRKLGDRWSSSREKTDCATPAATPAAVAVEVRQGINSPPELHAVDVMSGATEGILDLNPGFHRRQLSRARVFEWSTSGGRDWKGRLYYPVAYVPGRRYPLVVQTHGVAASDEFSLYGLGANQGFALGPGVTGFLAQVLAGRGIAVLQVPDVRVDRVKSILEPSVYMRTYETAVQRLVAEGIVDPGKVGLYGFSGTGWHVAYALAKSEAPYAAAIVTDNIDAGYLQAALTSWDTMYASDLNGAPPFGVGMKYWLENSPAFNVERIRTPLQLQVTDSGGGAAPVTALFGWELFTRLRYLGKPVELYLLPEISRGSHVPQHPGQLLALQERTLDWWRYWLQGEESLQPQSGSQYAQWRKLRELRERDLRNPRPPELSWTAEPRDPANPLTRQR